MAKNKRPAVAKVPTAQKKVPSKQLALNAAASARQSNLVVRFNRTDRGGPFCMSTISKEDHLLLLEKIEAYETMTVAAIFSGFPGKDYSLADGLPNKVAQERLEALPYGDQDQISRLQIGRLQRLYGFRQDPNFHVLWWDPLHEIWPSTLRNT